MCLAQGYTFAVFKSTLGYTFLQLWSSHWLAKDIIFDNICLGNGHILSYRSLPYGLSVSDKDCQSLVKDCQQIPAQSLVKEPPPPPPPTLVAETCYRNSTLLKSRYDRSKLLQYIGIQILRDRKGSDEKLPIINF